MNEYGQAFRAKYSARCHDCGKSIYASQLVRYRYPGKKICHADCTAAKNQAAAAKAEAPYSLGGGSGYGCRGWSVGQIVRAAPKLQEKGYPEWLYVVRAPKRFYHEDGLSVGVGADEGYSYSAACRAATDAEAAPAKAKYEEYLRREQAKARLKRLTETIEAGEYPAGPVIPEGRRFFDSQTIYGGGS